METWMPETYDPNVPMLKLDDSFEIAETFTSGFPLGFKQCSEDIVLTGKSPCNARWLRYR